MDYESKCITESNRFEISPEKFDEIFLKNKIKVVDVREHDELPFVTEFENQKIPLGELKNNLSELAKEDNIVFFCQSGIRSMQAATISAEYFGCSNRFYSLQGGIVSWKKAHKKQLV